MFLKAVIGVCLSLVSQSRGASSNTITIDHRSDNDYNGPLYIGSEYSETHLVYDTMSQWTVVNDQNCQGGCDEVPSMYDRESSRSAHAQFLDTDLEVPKSETVNLGSVEFTGFTYKE